MARSNALKLSKSTIDKAQPKTKRYLLWDSDLVGFGLRVEPTGSKTFFIFYRAGGGGAGAQQRTLKIGRFGPLTVDEARNRAKILLGRVAAGEDPSDEVQTKRKEMTVAGLVDYYEAHGCYVQRGVRIGEPMKPLTKQYTMARLRNHVVPLLGRKKISSITSGDIERFYADVTNGKSACDNKVGHRKRIVVRGGKGAATKVVRDLSAVFSFAKRSKFVDVNPCTDAAVRKTDNKKTRFLTLAEVRRLGEALDALEANGTNRKALDIVRLWALTGCRRTEIAALKWSEIDWSRGLLVLDDSKTGKSVRPLGGAALALLKGVDRQEHSEFVFPADSGEGHFQGYKTPWTKIVARAGLHGVTPHTLRHTLGSTATSAGEPLALTGAILGHSNPRSTAIYAHVQHEPSRNAANRVSRKIAGALLAKDANVNAGVSAKDLALLKRLSERLAEGDAGAAALRRAVQELAA